MDVNNPDKKPSTKGLSPKQKAFCREYIFDWNATRAYKIAYPNSGDLTARVEACKLLTKPNVKQYCELIQKDLEKLCGISRAKVLNEHMKLAYSSIAHLHNTWIQRKDFESLTGEQKDCIAEIDTKIRIEYEYNPDNPKEKKPIQVEYVKIKLYDKQKALDSISKMLGYDAPIKTELTGKDGKAIEIDFTSD
jgi:phage terminase small subunit